MLVMALRGSRWGAATGLLWEVLELPAAKTEGGGWWSGAATGSPRNGGWTPTTVLCGEHCRIGT